MPNQGLAPGEVPRPTHLVLWTVVGVVERPADAHDVGARVEHARCVPVQAVKDGLLAHADLEVCARGPRGLSATRSGASTSTRDAPRRMMRMSHFISDGVIFCTHALRMRACSALGRSSLVSVGPRGMRGREGGVTHCRLRILPCSSGCAPLVCASWSRISLMLSIDVSLTRRMTSERLLMTSIATDLCASPRVSEGANRGERTRARTRTRLRRAACGGKAWSGPRDGARQADESIHARPWLSAPSN